MADEVDGGGVTDPETSQSDVREPLDCIALELSAILRILAAEFPPPRRRHLTLVRKLIERFSAEGGDLDVAVRDDAGRAIVAVVQANRLRDIELWPEALNRVSQQMPTWGLPWCLAARVAIESGNLDLAHTWLIHADRLVPIGYLPLMSALDRLDIAAIPRNRHGLSLAAGRLLVRHRPSLTNIARVAWTALHLHDYPSLRDAVELAQRIHGNNPDHWTEAPAPGVHYWLGTLCLVTNRCAIHFKDYEHDHHSWNTAAIRNFEASRREGTTERDRTLASRWLTTTILYALRHYIDRLTDREFEHYMEIAQSDALPGQKVELLIARLRRPRAREAKSFERSVERALQMYDNVSRTITDLAYAAYLRDEWVACLIAIGRIKDAERYAKSSILPQRAAQARAMGDNPTAVSLLLDALAEASTTETARLDHAILIGEYASESQEFPTLLHKEATLALASLVPILQIECKRCLSQRLISRVKRLLYPLLMASPTLDSVSVDIVFQFLRATIRTGDTVAKSDPALWRLLARPELRAEASLVPLLFAHFDRIAATFEPLGDDGLWALANSVRGQFRAAAMQRCLQILSRPSYFNDRWAERAYFLVAQYPNSLGGDLLTTLWTNQGIRAIPTLTDLLSRLNAAQKTAAMRAYEDLPAECFQDAAFVDAIVESCMSPRHDSALVATRILTRGLARAQIAAWGEMQQLDPMVNWNAMVIQAAVPAALRRDAWLQWLTADSEEVEEIVAGRVRESIALLQRTLDDSEDLARLHGALDDFLRKRLDLWPEAQLSDAETDLCAELARRTEGGNRSALSLAFATLNVGEPLLLSAAMARVWLVTSRRMAQSIYSQVAAVSRPQLHAFKNELAKFADVGVAVPAQTVRTLRNMLVQEDSYLRSRRRAYRTSQDVRSVVESAVFRPPFVATWLRGSATAARFFVLRPADAIIAALDRELIVEAIHTLVQNAWTAVKDLGERGYVSVESARVNDSAIISVIDNGGGVSKIMLAALNAPDAPTTRGKVGFGARLVWQVARLHGGNIQYSFTPGSAGLRAQLEIPLSP